MGFIKEHIGVIVTLTIAFIGFVTGYVRLDNNFHNHVEIEGHPKISESVEEQQTEIRVIATKQDSIIKALDSVKLEQKNLAPMVTKVEVMEERTENLKDIAKENKEMLQELLRKK